MCVDVAQCMEKLYSVTVHLAGHQQTCLDTARISPVAHQAECRMRSFQQISGVFFDYLVELHNGDIILYYIL